MREKINKDIETMKNYNKSVSQIKISVESLANKVEQVENRVQYNN
jgi:hypothetical protein